MISEKLIYNCVNGDRKSHKECYETCAPYIYSIISSYISDKELRKDAMQESFAHIFLAMPTYDKNKASFKTWSSRIAINQTIGILRRRKKLSLMVPLSQAAEIKAEDQTFLTQLKKREIEQLLHKMPTGFKTVFMLSVIDEYKHKEIANLLEISEQTSRSQLSRAIRWVRKNLSTSTKNIIYG